MENKSWKGWLYLLPAFLFLGLFMVYPLIDVLIYSFEEGFNFAAQSGEGVGLYNYSFVLHDPFFLQAVKNTFILVAITVPLSTLLALAISLGISENAGGIPGLTAAAVVITGVEGAMLAPLFAKVFHITDPVAEGVAIGSCSHAIGTSKAMEIGSLQGAMSSIAICVCGIITSILVMFF